MFVELYYSQICSSYSGHWGVNIVIKAEDRNQLSGSQQGVIELGLIVGGRGFLRICNNGPQMLVMFELMDASDAKAFL